MELVSIQDYLVEGGIAEGESLTLLNPCCRRLRCSDIDLVLTGRGDGGSKTSEDVLFSQLVDKTGVPFLRNQVSAVRVIPFLEDI